MDDDKVWIIPVGLVGILSLVIICFVFFPPALQQGWHGIKWFIGLMFNWAVFMYCFIMIMKEIGE